MNHLRRHRWQTPIALIAILSLLWAQVVLASHPACNLALMATSTHAPHVGAEAAPARSPCHGDAVDVPSADLAVCESHCSQGDWGKDASRPLAVPVQALLPSPSLVGLHHLPHLALHAASATPRGAWHRPTPHPASLLLI